MATVHLGMTGDELHEEKRISTATTSEYGKIFTNSSETNFLGELRYLSFSEIENNEQTFSRRIPMDVAEEYYFPTFFIGSVQKVEVALDRALDANTTITLKSAGSTFATVVAASAGSSAGQVYTPTISSPQNVFNGVFSGRKLSIDNDGATNTSGFFTVVMTLLIDPDA